MLFRCNILALVGGSEQPAFPPNKVILWDDNQKSAIGELGFDTEVKAIKLRKDKIVVAEEKQVSVYTFDNLERSNRFSTYDNETGLLSVSSEEKCVIAFPHTEKGEVCISMPDTGKTTFIQAHDSMVQCLALNSDGTRLATASKKGTLIRIFDTITGEKLQEVRRGTEKALIYCISFNRDSSYICTSSDKGTIHIFSTGGASSNRKSKLSVFGGYFKSEWSLAHFKGPQFPSICTFGEEEDTVVVFSSNGNYYRIQFDPKRGGECKQKKFQRFYQQK